MKDIYYLLRRIAEKIKSLDDTVAGEEAKNIALEKAKEVYELAVRIERLSPDILYVCTDSIKLPEEPGDRLEDLYSILSSIEDELVECHRKALLKRHSIKASVYAAALLVYASTVLLLSITMSPLSLMLLSITSALGLAGVALNKYVAGSFSVLISALSIMIYGLLNLVEGLCYPDVIAAITTASLSSAVSLYSIVVRGSKIA